MENLGETEIKLTENLIKCRCCFRMLIDDRRAVVITEDIRTQFWDLCQIELIAAEIFADRICQLCASDLTVFSTLRQDLISKQKSLYELAGIDETNFYPKNLVCEEVGEVEQDEDENTSDYEMQFEETIEVESPFDEKFEVVVKEESDETEDAILTIEKIYDKQPSEGNNVEMEGDGHTSFDYFEEIVGSENAESDDQKYYESEYLRDEMISCDLCGIELAKSHFLQHVEVMHKTFFCHICETKFQSKITLKRHQLEAHGETEKHVRSKKRHYCPLCSKDYDYKKQLEDHIRSYHEKERNSQCSICQKLFYHRDLKKHMEHVHGDKNIACETCGKLYTCVENLRLHMRYHLPPSYVCSFAGCGKKFHQKVLWEHHEQKHGDVKPHNCDHCNASFFSIRDMKRHHQRVHLKITKKCFLCDNQFSRKDKLRLHIMKKHQELSDADRDGYLEEVRNMKWS